MTTVYMTTYRITLFLLLSFNRFFPRFYFDLISPSRPSSRPPPPSLLRVPFTAAVSRWAPAFCQQGTRRVVGRETKPRRMEWFGRKEEETDAKRAEGRRKEREARRSPSWEPGSSTRELNVPSKRGLAKARLDLTFHPSILEEFIARRAPELVTEQWKSHRMIVVFNPNSLPTEAGGILIDAIAHPHEYVSFRRRRSR